MMWRLWSMPPHTLGDLTPASFATSTNVTGDAGVGFEIVAASSRALRFHFHSGVASAARSVLPRRVAEEPRNRRRGNFIYWLSLARFSEMDAARFLRLPLPR